LTSGVDGKRLLQLGKPLFQVGDAVKRRLAGRRRPFGVEMAS
jgi:hypothetical protein